MLRRSILQAHANLAKAAATSDGVYSLGFFPTDMLDSNACTAVRCKNLRQENVTLQNLVQGKVHTGCVLQGILHVKPCRLSNVAFTVLEDDNGGLAKLMAFNSLLWNSTQADVEKMYPQGAQVRLRDPLLQSITCLGSPLEVLWVSNPMALEIVSYFPKVGVTDPQVYLSWGMNEVALGNHSAAVDLFNRCIEHCDVNQNKVLMVDAHARKAEAWLASEHFDKALGDAEEGLGLDPFHARCLLSKGLALCGLRQYIKAHECLKLAKDATAGTTDSDLEKLIKDAYDESVTFVQQSRDGKYDLSEYYAGMYREESAPKLAEYVGPLKIDSTPDGKGRGLFLTQNVSKGDILMVNNAVALVLPDYEKWKPVPKEEFENEVERTLYIMILRACMASKTTLAQVLSLAEYDKQSKKMMSKPVPKMDLFTDTVDPEDLNMDFDVSRIFNCMHPEWNFAKDTLVSSDFCGLWTLPAFINHSCLPNVSLHRVGKALLVVAARDMKRGTELLRCYEGAFVPWKSRLQKSDVDNCECQRCQLEKALENEFKDITSKFQGAQGNIGVMSQVAVEIEEKLMELSMLTEEHRDWIRASYVVAYLGYYNMFRQLEGIERHKLVPCAEDMMHALHMTAPGYSSTLKVMCWLYKLGNNKQDAKKLLLQECISRCGHLETHVFHAIVKDTMRKAATSWSI